MSKEDDVQFGWYVVMMVDFLSQREQLAHMRKIPETSEEMLHFISAATKTFGTLDWFRKTFLKYFADWDLPPENCTKCNESSGRLKGWKGALG